VGTLRLASRLRCSRSSGAPRRDHFDELVAFAVGGDGAALDGGLQQLRQRLLGDTQRLRARRINV